jgi:hypothetical protein
MANRTANAACHCTKSYNTNVTVGSLEPRLLNFVGKLRLRYLCNLSTASTLEVTSL